MARVEDGVGAVAGFPLRNGTPYVGLSVALGRNLAALTLGLRSRRANHGAGHVGR